MSHGFPRTPLPTMTPSQPVSRNILDCILGTANIATPDHGDPQLRLQSGDKPPVRIAAEALIDGTRDGG